VTCVHVWELEPDKREEVGVCRLCGVSRVHKGGWEEGYAFVGAASPAEQKAAMRRGAAKGGAAIKKKAAA
jgi:hypothetical protein